MDKATVSILVFVGAYILFVFLPNRRSLVAVGAAAVLVLTQTVTLHEAVEGINWNVMGIFVGMLIAADVFIESRCPAYLAELIVNRARSTAWAMLFICALTSGLSIFVENVATVLIIAPVALALAKKLDINPVNMLIGIAICSNLQGAATLIGDPPSMLLGGYAKMTFLDFFFYHGKPSIFFAVELGALTSLVVLYFVFRCHREKTSVVPVEVVRSWMPTLMLVILVIALAASSFFDKGFSYLAGTICMVFGVLMLAWEKLVHGGRIWESMRRLDWDTTFFLMGIFIVVESLTVSGWISWTSDALSHVIGENIFLGYTVLVFVAMVVSGFVDNVPFLAAMLPVAMELSDKLSVNPALFLFGLLIGSSLGGNITPIGASANIVACGMLKKEGHTVTFTRFGKIAVPFTIAAVVPAYLLIWFLWR
ncbi:MAG: TRAP transporter large permease subunit [Candidatus Hydrogenedentes bacterium]|nr:TRAP transporter large permease subunit [Candidatus Hydrogenedentota bacterium]